MFEQKITANNENKPLKQVNIYTDGACSGNPGAGGWACILVYGEREKEISGGEKETTNNRMELTAVIEGLSALKERCEVTIYSDSTYVLNGLTKGWAESWRKNGWIKGDKKPALNPDLWEKLLNLTAFHKMNYVWVKGHNGHDYNERCDRLAVSEYEKLR